MPFAVRPAGGDPEDVLEGAQQRVVVVGVGIRPYSRRGIRREHHRAGVAAARPANPRARGVRSRDLAAARQIVRRRGARAPLLVEDDDDHPVLAVGRRGLDQMDVRGQPLVPGRAVMAVVDHVGGDEGQVGRRLRALQIRAKAGQCDNVGFAVGAVVIDRVKPDEVVVLGYVGVELVVFSMRRAGRAATVANQVLAHVLLIALPTQALGL